MSVGFVAGTLVHTDKGLVPIQNLQVGDLALTNDGLKPVLNVFKLQDKQKIYKIEYFNEILDNQGERGKNYLFCNESQSFFITKKPNTKKGKWIQAKDLPAGYLFSNKKDTLSLDDYAYMPVRTLPNYPKGCAYFQSIEYHEEGWNDIGNVEFVRFDENGYQFICLADSKEGYEKEIATLNVKTNDSILHLNEELPFVIDSELYKTLNVRLQQDIDSETRTPEILMVIMNSPMIINGVVVRENRMVDEILFKKALDNITKYGSNLGLTDTSLHEEVNEYYDEVKNPYVDYIYNIEVADTHTYFVGYDGVLTGDLTINA